MPLPQIVGVVLKFKGKYILGLSVPIILALKADDKF